jgi:murein DD-endopeptidase MepM/ murein hydrolase activator NlpD
VTIRKFPDKDLNLPPLKKKGRLRRKVLIGFLVLLAYYFVIPPFVWPVRGPITSGYFFRLAPDAGIFPGLEMHSGCDIAVPRGSSVRASKGGTVVDAGFSKGAGNYLVLEHWLGFSSFYAHLDRVTVAKGQYVFKWQEVGKSGSTGRSTGPHLHLEVRFLGMRLPPELLCLFDSLRRWVGL